MEYRRARRGGRGRRRCVVFGFVTSGPPPSRWPGIRTMTVEKKMDDASAVWREENKPLLAAGRSAASLSNVIAGKWNVD